MKSILSPKILEVCCPRYLEVTRKDLEDITSPLAMLSSANFFPNTLFSTGGGGEGGRERDTSLLALCRPDAGISIRKMDGDFCLLATGILQLFRGSRRNCRRCTRWRVEKNDTSSTGKNGGRYGVAGRSSWDRSWSALTSLRLHVDLGSGCRRMRSVILLYVLRSKSVTMIEFYAFVVAHKSGRDISWILRYYF